MTINVRTTSKVKQFRSTLKKMLMLPAKMIRSLFSVLLVCVIALNSFISPAFADTGSPVDSFASADIGSAIDSFGRGFWPAFGGVVGGAVGTVAACYAVNVLIAPIAPPIAAYLATVCPAVGAAVGGVGGAVGAGTVVRAN